MKLTKTVLWNVAETVAMIVPFVLGIFLMTEVDHWCWNMLGLIMTAIAVVGLASLPFRRYGDVL